MPISSLRELIVGQIHICFGLKNITIQKALRCLGIHRTRGSYRGAGLDDGEHEFARRRDSTPCRRIHETAASFDKIHPTLEPKICSRKNSRKLFMLCGPCNNINKLIKVIYYC